MFYEKYLQSIFCSFLDKSAFVEEADRSPFLTTAIICLVSRHLTADVTQQDFGFCAGTDLCEHYTPIAKALARESLDRPSGTSTPFLTGLQLRPTNTNSDEHPSKPCFGPVGASQPVWIESLDAGGNRDPNGPDHEAQ